MNIQEYDILNAIFTTTNPTQRSLADCSGHSLGIVNPEYHYFRAGLWPHD